MYSRVGNPNPTGKVLSRPDQTQRIKQGLRDQGRERPSGGTAHCCRRRTRLSDRTPVQRVNFQKERFRATIPAGNAKDVPSLPSANLSDLGGPSSDPHSVREEGLPGVRAPFEVHLSEDAATRLSGLPSCAGTEKLSPDTAPYTIFRADPPSPRTWIKPDT